MRRKGQQSSMRSSTAAELGRVFVLVVSSAFHRARSSFAALWCTRQRIPQCCRNLPVFKPAVAYGGPTVCIQPIIVEISAACNMEALQAR